jgi:hypothetical protein
VNQDRLSLGYRASDLLSLDRTSAALKDTLDLGSGLHVSTPMSLHRQIPDDLFRQTGGLARLIERRIGFPG